MTCEKIVLLSNIAKQVQQNGFFNHSHVLVFQKNKESFQVASFTSSSTIRSHFIVHRIKFKINVQEGLKKKEKIILFFNAIYALTQFLSVSNILSSKFYLQHISAMFFISVVWKLSVDLRPLELIESTFQIGFLNKISVEPKFERSGQ